MASLTAALLLALTAKARWPGNAPPTPGAPVAAAAAGKQPAQNRPVVGKRTLLGFVMMTEGQRLGCVFTVERIGVRPDAKKSGGIADAEVPLPPRGLTVGGLIKFIRKHAPRYTVWRDSASKSVIHVALTRLLRWKGNPLNRRLTFVGVATIGHLESVFLRRKFPAVRFHNLLPPSDPGVFPVDPDPAIIHKPFRFDVRNVTLRSFLTSGLAYHFGGRGFGGGQLWTATFRVRGGKITGQVYVSLQGLGLIRLKPAPSRGDG
jgi:hypothetical protein